MKKLLFTLVIGVVSIVTTKAQDNVIKVNPLAILGGTDLVSYERVINYKTSFIVSAAYGSFKFSDVKYSSFGAGAQYRYYFRDVLEGWYGAPEIAFQSGKTETSSFFDDEDSDEISFSALRIGVKAGYQWVWRSGFSLDLNLGFGYANFNYDSNDDDSLISLLRASGFIPSFGFAIGYAF